jgi:cysteinyl-tRNA synthetase
MTIKVYNTLSKVKEKFQTEDQTVSMYVCGPTVYNYIHIGNARVFVFFDVVRRYLANLGYRVKYVQNFTDVDDKLIKASIETGKSMAEIAEQYTEAYFEDMDALGVHRADVHPKATEHIGQMIDAIQTLIEKGKAYEVDGDVYFRTLRQDGYGKLSHQSLEDLQSGARVEVNEIKEHPFDFALWKRAKEGEVSWETPWGTGRPGWHIECSVMAKEYLGETLDIHAGGIDLCFPHHENEIAQSEALNEKPFVRYWLHNGFINMENEKMSKSLGNVMRVYDMRKMYSPKAIRYFLLSAHYRNPINFTSEVMKQAEQSAERLQTAVDNLRHRSKTSLSGIVPTNLTEQLEQLSTQFAKEMNDDFNAANGITVLFDAVRVANEWLAQPVISKEAIESLLNWFRTYGENVLGLVDTRSEEVLEEEIERLIEDRQNARKQRNFQRADEIRDQLLLAGIVLEDTPQGVRWKKK